MRKRLPLEQHGRRSWYCLLGVVRRSRCVGHFLLRLAATEIGTGRILVRLAADTTAGNVLQLDGVTILTTSHTPSAILFLGTALTTALLTTFAAAAISVGAITNFETPHAATKDNGRHKKAKIHPPGSKITTWRVTCSVPTTTFPKTSTT